MRREKRFAISLSLAIAAVVFAGTFLLSGLAVWLDYQSRKRSWQQELHRDMFNLASNLQRPLQLLLARHEWTMLQQTIENLASDRRLRQVLLLDETRRIRAAPFPNLIGREVAAAFSDARALSLLERAREQKRILCEPASDASLLLTLIPLPTTAAQHFAREAVPVLMLALDTTFVERELRTHLGISLLIYMLNGMIFALLTFLVLEHIVGHPIRHLATVLHRVRNGNLHVQARIPRLTELSHLARAFNDMVLQLRTHQEALHARQRELEQLYHSASRMKERYQKLLELAQEGIVIVDAQDVIRYVNPAFARSLEYEEGELIGRSILTLIPEEEHARVAVETEKRRRGHSSHYELHMRTKRGQMKTFLMSASPLQDDAGEFSGALAVTVDITELKQKEEALRASEKRYADLYNNAPDGYHTLAPDMTFLEMNETELRWLGYRREELVGRMTLFDVTDARGREIFERALPLLQETGTVQELEMDLVRRDGTRFPVRMNITIERETPDGLLRYRATVRDITEKKNLEKQLIQAQRLEAIGAVAGGIAHDFNNLLTGMLGFTELALRELGPQDPRAELLHYVLQLGQRGAQLVRQLLSFSSPMDIRRTPLDPREFLEEMNLLLRRILPETIEIRLDLPEAIPNIEADPLQLQQIVMNLAINARDAMPQGGTLTIACDAVALTKPGLPPLPLEARPGTYVRLSVADTGVGMTPEIQARIFEPFFTTKEVGKGSGLGLSVVYGIVRSHGGFITVWSAPGQGSRFDIYLPATERTTRVEEDPAGRPARGANELILLADDEATLLDLEEKILRTHGYRVLTARDGEEAVRRYWEHREEIVLVILDALMPGITGIEAAHRIKASNARAKILLVTGYSPEESGLGRITRLAGIHLLEKPYTPRQLLETIARLLDKSPEEAAVPSTTRLSEETS